MRYGGAIAKPGFDITAGINSCDKRDNEVKDRKSDVVVGGFASVVRELAVPVKRRTEQVVREFCKADQRLPKLLGMKNGALLGKNVVKKAAIAQFKDEAVDIVNFSFGEVCLSDLGFVSIGQRGKAAALGGDGRGLFAIGGNVSESGYFFLKIVLSR